MLGRLNRSIIYGLVACVIVVGAAAEAEDAGFESVIGTGHDLAADPRLGGGLDTCAYCHKVDASSGEVLAELNRRPPASDISEYGMTRLGTSTSGLSDISAHCLSCHDGVTPLDAVGSREGTKSNAMGGLFPGSSAIFGAGLKTHHPIGLGFPDHPEYAEASAIADSELRLFEGKVECLTCHDVHGQAGFEQFLVSDNENSAMCFACHTGK